MNQTHAHSAIVAAFVVLMTGCASSPEQVEAQAVAQGLAPSSATSAEKDVTTFRIVEVDGKKIELADTSYTEKGMRISCQQYVKSVTGATDGHSAEIQIDKTCSNELVEFSIRTDSREATATMQMGTPTPLQLAQDTQSGHCNFRRDFGGSPVDTSLTLDVSSGMDATFIPIERTARGVKAFIHISNQSAQTQEWAAVGAGCKLPIGSTRSVSLRMVDTFKWGQPTKLKLSDGSVVIVTAKK